MIKVCPTCEHKYPEDTEFCARDGTRLQDLQDDVGDPLVGRVLDGRWVIEERIGEGGMGAVYRGSQRSVDRQVAIKTLRPELCNSREFVDRFFREARVASTIAHPHCVTILDFGQTDDGTLYLAMEYLEGMPLTTRLHHPDLSIREIIQICMQISSALAAAHDNNVIHRDLKPDNVFLLSISDGSTFTKVLDFGIAKVTDSDEKMTKTGQVFGTPEYMSPEQCRGDELDGRSDLYSLGCILYRMLSGRPPFQSDTPMAVLVSHVSESPDSILEVTDRDDIPVPLSDLCMQLLAKQAAGRPANAQAVRASLEEMLGHTNSRSTPRVDAAAAASGDEPASGRTLATESADLVHDGGDRLDDISANSAQRPGASDRAGAPTPQPSQRTPSPDTQTTSPPPARARKKKSLLPLILGVGVAVIIAATCALGALYLGYTYFIAEDGDAVSIAGLFGEDDEAEGGGEQALADGADKGSGEIPDDDEQARADATAPDESESADAPRHEPEGEPSEERATDERVEKEISDNEAGEAAPVADSEEAKGGAQTRGGGSAGDDDREEKSPPAGTGEKREDSGNPTGEGEKTANVEINADRADIAVSAKSDGSSEDESAPESNSAPKNAPAEPAKTSQKEDNKPTAASPKGTIRQSNLSASGNACVKPNVESVLRQSERSFLDCYSDELAASPEMAGEAMLAWNISTDGTILKPEVLVSDVDELNACLVGKLKRLDFDPPVGGRCYVRATYQFRP